VIALVLIEKGYKNTYLVLDGEGAFLNLGVPFVSHGKVVYPRKTTKY
jgi:hypothetical protein